jgi:two-component system phosphate regulon sensor histidine kinase PhoR
MESWLIAGIALIALALLGWQWRAARQAAHQLRRQLAAAQHDLQNAQSDERALRAFQASAGSAVKDPLLTLDADQHVTWANPRAVKLFGDPIGKPLIQVTHSYELEALAGEALRSAGPLDRSVVLNGLAYAVRTAPLPTDSVVMALKDVSEVQRLGRARRDFVANISHELRTPLASIRLLVDTLQSGALGDPRLAGEMLSKINVEVEALSQLARELLDLAMIESGQMPLKLEPTDLHVLAQAQIERFMPQALQKGLALVMDIAPGTCALADGEMIGRVLTNLLHNACKFTPADGQITISTQIDGDNVIVSIADTGPGIPPESLSRIFERFYKVDRARGQSGTGLGLAIARHIVEGHGGRIWAESNLGHGATFRFTLPAC